MATSGRKIDEQTQRQIVKLREINRSIRDVAKITQTSTRTVQKYLRQRS